MRLVVADDSALFREDIIGLLMRQSHEVAAEVTSADEFVKTAARTAPDVVVVDVRMSPGVFDGDLRAAVQIRESQPEIGIMVLSRYVASVYVTGLFESSAPVDDVGGLDYLLKNRVARVANFIRSLRVVEAGSVAADLEVVNSSVKSRSSRLNGLTTRESEILELVARGLSNHQICERMSLSTAAVSRHVVNVFSKLGMLPGEENRRMWAVLAYLMGKRN